MIRKEKYDYEKKYNEEEFTERMKDINQQNRDYLFGRLIAIYERIEETSLLQQGKMIDNRTTQVAKRFSAIITSPAKTLSLIYEKTHNIILKNKYGKYYDALILEIINVLSNRDEYTNNRLGKDWVLGYYAQRNDFFKKKEED